MPEKTGPDLGVKRYETFKVGGSISTDRCASKSSPMVAVLKPGQLRVVLHCLSQCGFDALFDDLRKSMRIGVVQFYRHRREAVPWIGRSKNGRLFRRPRTTNERRAHYSNEATKEILVSRGLAFKLRQERNSNRLPNAHDDLSLRYQRSWKEHRGA